MSPAPRIGFGSGRYLAAILLLAVAETAQAVPPTADFYPHKSYQRKEYGWGATSYWLYEPADPKPEKAAVVVLNHGWLGVNPGVLRRVD